MGVLAERVKALREAYNWSMAELARRAADVENWQTIQQIENGKVEHPRSLNSIAKAFNVRPEDLTDEKNVDLNEVLTRMRRTSADAASRAPGENERDENMELRKQRLAKRIFDHLLERPYNEVASLATVLHVEPPEDTERPQTAGQR